VAIAVEERHRIERFGPEDARSRPHVGSEEVERDVAPGLTLLDLFTFPRISDLAAHLASSTGTRTFAGASREGVHRRVETR
jgi:hypothetical protein